jgi:UDP-hydrolysing UDP-N-acetyl-D-glucosamine 2-epimerase
MAEARKGEGDDGRAAAPAPPRRVGVVTVARSDFGHLRSVLAAIREEPSLELVLLVAAGHLAPRLGHTVDLIAAEGWPIAERIETVGESDGPEAVTASTGRAVSGFAQALARRRPDIVVVLGDRVEMLAAAVAALPLGIPVAHVHGGEVTEGAIDEQARHALTKLSHLHFAAAEEFARRLRQMGEEPWRVHRTGAPGLDRFRTAPSRTRAELAATLGVPLDRPTLILTYHPVTLEPATWPAELDALLAAVAGVDADVVATYPGADAGHRLIVERLEAFARAHPRVRLAASLGDDVYASLLREADAMVGNSSSGIIEAASFALPVVNVGRRQHGRLRPAGVIDAGSGRDGIAAALRRALDPAFRRGLAGLENPYGDGRAAPRIVRVLRDVELGPRLLTKRFVDLA